MIIALVSPRRDGRALLAMLTLAGIACVAGASGCSSRRQVRPPTIQAATSSERDVLEADILFYRERAARDPSGAADLAHLSALYLERARQSGDQRDAVLAEQAARHSLANRSTHNAAARQVLASALLAQHRFDEALVVAKRVRDSEPSSPALRAMVAEIEMELGAYDSAKVGFASLDSAKHSLAVAPRLARWAEIRGHTEAARRYMRDALATAQRTPGMPREQVAWFWLRAGDIELRDEKFAAADSAYQAGLRANPNDYRVLAGLARLAAARGNWRAAAHFGEASIASNLDPATLGIVSDAYAALGDTAKAAEFARALDVAVSHQPGAYHRAWSLFLLDHDRRVSLVSRNIRKEMKSRRDIYAYDLLAWSLHKQGRDIEALSAIHMALGQGTKDPLLARHAAAIEAAVSNTTEAAR
ncbi:MAG TPA: tetratricopeptide repeat protein [Gemmatimonadaceae bacterium]|nr:tetratricopeptide repeat protein [Gemmatimonadaceae bacterium]